MKLSKETMSFISNVIKVAKILRIENIIIDNECIRGHLQEEGSMIIHKDNLPIFEFQSLGISRINTLDTRLSLLGDDCTVDAEEKEKTPTEKLIYKLLISNKKTEVEFKCADPSLMPKSPKNLKDPVFFSFEIDEDTVNLLVKAQSAIKGDTISFAGNKKGVIAKLSDIEGDMLNHILCEELLFSSECDKEKFLFSYKNKVLLSLLKEIDFKEKILIHITKRGILNIKVRGINIYIAPEL